MSGQELYSVECVTEGTNITSLLPGAANACPNDSSHTIVSTNLNAIVDSNYEVTESLAETTFSGAVPADVNDPADPNFATKIDFTTSSVLPVGTYVLNWSYGFFHTAFFNFSDFVGRIVTDDATVDMIHVEEVQEAARSQRMYNAGSIEYTFGTAATHNFKLQLGTGFAAFSSTMFDARLEVQRIS